MMVEARIMNCIDLYASLTPEAPAVLSHHPGQLSYAQLRALVYHAEQWFGENGFGINDRIGTVFTDNFTAAIAFLAVSNSSVCVPLNPDFTQDELDHYLKLINIKALLVQEGEAEKVKRALKGRRVEIIQWAFRKGHRLELSLLTKKRFGSKPSYNRGSGVDVALILFTSGTTAQPKVIPRTHRELCAMAQNSVKAYSLTSSDRYFTVRPFHFIASILAMLASVSVGGSFVFSDNLETTKLFTAIQEIKPTWLGFPPVIYQAMVAEINGRHLQDYDLSSLRFLHSTGAPLPPQVAQQLEEMFNIPVVNTYGMTETGILACNYRIPQRDGSVGKIINTEVGIMDEKGKLLLSCAVGEVVARGLGVIKNYENNPEANKTAFQGGWFKTGDCGYLDQDGYLYITGRTKELINRGGQKVSPYEIEKIILQHPDISDAVVFPFPHSKFGEEIAVAVVLGNSQGKMSLKNLRSFLMEKIAFFKIPSKLFNVDRIPVGPNGKVQRNKLYQYFKHMERDLPDIEPDFSPAQNQVERELINICRELLEVENIGIRDDFFELGGDSLQVARLYSKIEEIWGCKIHISEFYREATVKNLAEMILDDSIATLNCPFIVPIQKNGSKPPLFCVHPIRGEALKYWELASSLGDEQPVYGLRFHRKSLDKDLGMEQLAARYIEGMLSVQPKGPYFLAGYSLGGVIAFEIARQLAKSGYDMGMVAMIDTDIDILKEYIQSNTDHPIRRSTFEKLYSHFRRIRGQIKEKIVLKPEKLLNMTAKRYKPELFAGEILYFAAEGNPRAANSIAVWSQLTDSIKVVNVKGDHDTIMYEPHVIGVAREIQTYMEKAILFLKKLPNGDSE